MIIKFKTFQVLRVFRGCSSGFTLFECVLALMIFSIAVVSLVEVINTLGTAGIEVRQEQAMQARLAAMLLEITRKPLPPNAQSGGYTETRRENGVSYDIRISPLELKNKDNAPLPGIFTVQINARWDESGHEQHSRAETWLYPPLYAPQP